MCDLLLILIIADTIFDVVILKLLLKPLNIIMKKFVCVETLRLPMYVYADVGACSKPELHCWHHNIF